MLSDVTPLILTRNEEANIGRTLAPLQWADRIVVIDSLSTDGTLAIARQTPQVEVLQREFDSFANQWNFGLAQIRTPWVLTLDADYVCSPALAAEIDRRTGEALAGWSASFRYCVEGKPLRATLYPRRVVLFRPDRARYVQDGHSQSLRVEDPVRALEARIDHDDRKPRAVWLDAQRRYAAEEVEKLTVNASDRLAWIDRLRRLPFLVPALTPWYCLLAKGLLLDGRRGLLYTAERTYAELLLSLLLADRWWRGRGRQT